MNFAGRQGMEEPELNLTSLVDVVFSLIIFSWSPPRLMIAQH